MATTDYTNMHRAREAKDDEFYTRMDDVEAEMWYHREKLKGKRVHCNCGDPGASAFARYFRMRFKIAGIGEACRHGPPRGQFEAGGRNGDGRGRRASPRNGRRLLLRDQPRHSRRIRRCGDQPAILPVQGLHGNADGVGRQVLRHWAVVRPPYKEIFPSTFFTTECGSEQAGAPANSTLRRGGWISEPVVHQHLSTSGAGTS